MPDQLTRQKIKLTRTSVDDLEPPATGYRLYWDSEVANFGVRVTSGGVRAYIVQGRINGRERRITIGRCAMWTAEKARTQAKVWLGKIADGEDPQEKGRHGAEGGQTLAELLQAYADNLKARGKTRTAKDVENAVKVHLTKALPRIAKLPAREVKRRDIATVVRTVAEKGKRRRAGMLRSYLFAAYNLALRAESDPSVPSALLAYNIEASPVVGVATVAAGSKARNRVLSDDELKHFLAALDASDSAARDAVKLALLAGGQRIQQVLRLEVGDVYEDGTIRLLDPKGRRTEVRQHFVPLAAKGKALALSLATAAKNAGATLLFSSDGKKPVRIETAGACVADISAQMVTDKQAAEPFQARDLRRTAETRLAALGISRDLRAQLLSHGLSGVQAKHYDRHDYAEEKRRALIAWERHLSDVAAGKTTDGAKVTTIKRKRA